jgi:hypothetical protein
MHLIYGKATHTTRKGSIDVETFQYECHRHGNVHIFNLRGEMFWRYNFTLEDKY